MHVHSIAEGLDERSWFEELEHSGILNAMLQAVLNSSTKQTNQRSFDNDMLSERSSGDDAWNYMDEEIVHMANRYQLTIIWVQPTSNPKIKMLFVVYKNRLISFHRIKVKGNAARYALHREPIKDVPVSLFQPINQRKVENNTLSTVPKQLGPNESIYTPNQLIELVEERELTYWMFTYEATTDRLPKWAVMGRAYQGQRKLQGTKDVMRILKFIHPEDAIIDLNPGPETPPPPRFGVAKKERREGEE